MAKLRERPGKDLVVLGSGELVRSLMRRNLVDEYVLLIHPLILGSGRRLFDDTGPRVALELDHRRRHRQLPPGIISGGVKCAAK